MDSTFDPDGFSQDLDPRARARSHASLCGTLAAGAGPGEAAQATAALEPRLDTDHLGIWAERVKKQLEASDYSFRLGVPDDEAALETRVAALAVWAREFLAALGRAGERLNALDPEAHETLRELDAIGQGAAVGEDDSETEELMYAELAEHVRLSALLLYQALNPPGSRHS